MDKFNTVWMNDALILANQAAAEDEVPVGAVVIYENQIIGRGYNTREKDQNPLAHAEIAAIHQASGQIKSWRLNDCILVVTLEPCPMCLAACQQARLEKVYFGAKDSKGGAISLGYRLHEDLRTNHRFQVNYVETPECSRVLKEFFAKVRKQTS
jgi:tRNA(adenine34) deaminase